MLERIEQICERGRGGDRGRRAPPATLEELRVRYLGRKAELTAILRGIAELPAEQRGPVGKAANEARVELEELLERGAPSLDAAELEARLGGDRIDVTLPGAPAAQARPRCTWSRAPGGDRGRDGRPRLPGRSRAPRSSSTTTTSRRSTTPRDTRRGWSRTPSTSPRGRSRRRLEQARKPVLELPSPSWSCCAPTPRRCRSGPWRPRRPPIFITVPGKAFRRDTIDATHLPMFHQMEGLAVGEGITLADLQGTLEAMLARLFGEGVEARMRPHFFPFTEPSVEFDVSCYVCDGTGVARGARCSLCKGIGWIEVGGAGMVDPNVLGFVESNGYDPEKVQGFAFGFGIERMAMLLHGLPDLRLFVENDVRVLEQFS